MAQQSTNLPIQSTTRQIIQDYNRQVGFKKIQFVYETQTGAWADPVTPPINGLIVIIYNSTQAASRLYAYSNGAWTYVALT